MQTLRRDTRHRVRAVQSLCKDLAEYDINSSSLLMVRSLRWFMLVLMLVLMLMLRLRLRLGIRLRLRTAHGCR